MAQFDDDFAAVDSLLSEAFGDSATYIEPDGTEHAIAIEWVMREHELRDRDGFVTRVRVQEGVVLASELAELGRDPQRGDRIAMTVDSTQHVWELAAHGDMPEAEWADSKGRRWILRTKHVSP